MVLNWLAQSVLLMQQDWLLAEFLIFDSSPTECPFISLGSTWLLITYLLRESPMSVACACQLYASWPPKNLDRSLPCRSPEGAHSAAWPGQLKPHEAQPVLPGSTQFGSKNRMRKRLVILEGQFTCITADWGNSICVSIFCNQATSMATRPCFNSAARLKRNLGSEGIVSDPFQQVGKPGEQLYSCS